MLPPLALESPPLELSWMHYNCPPEWPAFGDSGTQTVPAVVHGAWRHGEAAAVVLVNVDRVAHEIDVRANAVTLRLDRDRGYEITRIDGTVRTSLGPLSADGALAVSLPPREVVVLEVAP